MRNEESRYFIEHIYKTIQISMAQGAELIWYFWMIFFRTDWANIFLPMRHETLLKPVDVSDIRVILWVLFIVIIIKLLWIILILIHSIAEVLDVPQILLMLLWTFVWSTNPLSTRTDAKNSVKNVRKKYFRPHQALHSTTVSAPSSYFLLFRLQTKKMN